VRFVRGFLAVDDQLHVVHIDGFPGKGAGYQGADLGPDFVPDFWK
jgi:hypothetical protein